MNARSVSKRAGRRFGMRKTTGAACMMAAMLGCALAQSYERPTLKRDSAVTESRPDLHGLWVARYPNDPKAILAYFDVAQSGDRVIVSLMPTGKPPIVLFEGSFQSNTTLAGRAIDITSSPENPKYVRQTVTVRDANHIELDAHTLLTRAGEAEASSFKQARQVEPRQVESQPLRKEPFMLTGKWRYEKGTVPDIFISVNNGEVTVRTAQPYQPVFWRGKYESNPVIQGKAWGDGYTDKNPVWVDAIIKVESPDRIRYGGVDLFIRISDPPKNDIPCESANSYHITDFHAFRRGLVAMNNKNQETARCWLEISAGFGYAAAQSSLASVLIVNREDDRRAFDLASESANKGYTAAELQLAAMYREGVGTTADPAKADYWQQKANQARDAAAWKQISGALSLMDIVSKGMKMVPAPDLGFGPMVPSDSCFSQPLGNRQTTACQH